MRLISTRKNYKRFAWIVGTMFLIIQANAFSNRPSDPPQKGETRIHLLNADSLMYDVDVAPDAQRMSGNVHFLHKGMHLYCDSAVLYEKKQVFEAYNHVRMEQGDTLSLVGDYLRYDGNTLIAEVRNNVVMTHRDQILITDSLNYDRLYSLGYYFEGGELEDGENTLTSDWGEYSTATRKASFYYGVELKNSKFNLFSDTLHYDTQSKWANVMGASRILSGENRVNTTCGYYNSDEQLVKLYDRSEIFNGGKRMVGDKLFYDKKTGLMTAYGNILYEDSIGKNGFAGEFCKYNEITGEALAHGKAVLKDFSNERDTLYVHADTLKMFSFHLDTDSLYRVFHGYFHVRAFSNQVQAVCDSLVGNSREKKMTLYRDPIVWSGTRQILGEEINVFSNDSTIDSVYVQRQALMVEQVDSTHFNQVSGDLMRSYFDRNGNIKENRVDRNVYVVFYPLEKDSLLLYQNYTETTQLRMFMENRRMKKLWSPSSKGFFYPIGMAPAEQTTLTNFAWFDYVRPLNKDDIFNWRPKKLGTELKPSVRREPPLQKLKP